LKFVASASIRAHIDLRIQSLVLQTCIEKGLNLWFVLLFKGQETIFASQRNARMTKRSSRRPDVLAATTKTWSKFNLQNILKLQFAKNAMCH